MKKKILSILLIFTSYVCSFAQSESFDPKMSAFYDYCLDVRQGVMDKDVKALENCIADWDGKKVLTYKDKKIKLDSFNDDDIKKIDTSGIIDLTGHLQFSPEFVDSLISTGIRLEHFPGMNELMSYYTVTPDLRRGGEYDCLHTHVAIAAGGKISYKFTACGECEGFILTENGSKVYANLTLDNQAKPSFEKKSDAPRFKWNMEYGQYILTIKNPTDKNISVIIASN